MIIFNLDGTLADCEHRRHFVDPEKNENFCRYNGNEFRGYEDGQIQLNVKWKPDWKSFYEACDQDKPIEPIIALWNNEISLGNMGLHKIWSIRCESVRKKTEEWLDKHLLCFESHQLKMRPIGDFTSDDQLKERWLDETIRENRTVDFVFDASEKCCNMWRRKGIFVFDVNQSVKNSN